jgi:hypothetical protein
MSPKASRSASRRWGYPATLAFDAAVGMIMLLLPLMGPKREAPRPALA